MLNGASLELSLTRAKTKEALTLIKSKSVNYNQVRSECKNHSIFLILSKVKVSAVSKFDFDLVVLVIN